MNSGRVPVQQPTHNHHHPFWGVLNNVAGGSQQQQQQQPQQQPHAAPMPMGANGMPPPMLSAGLPASFFPAFQQQAMAAAARENGNNNVNNVAVVATAKLAPTKAKKGSSNSCNSSLVVRSSVRKWNGTVYFSVAQWTRKCVEENLEWLVKLAKRRHPEEDVVLLTYGDGCETLLLMDDHVNKMPTDFRNVSKVGVGVSVANLDDKCDEDKVAKNGVLQPSDCMWEHVNFEQQKLQNDEDAKPLCLYIHTNITVWSDGLPNLRRVVQVLTGEPDNPMEAKKYVPNSQFEAQVLAAWNGVKHRQAAGANGVQMPFFGDPTASSANGETVITFNPKELIMLEKAFNETLTAADFKVDCGAYTEKDAIAAQSVIRRAQGVAEVKKRVRKAPAAKKPTPKKESADVAEFPEAEKKKEGDDSRDNVDEQEAEKEVGGDEEKDISDDNHKSSDGEKQNDTDEEEEIQKDESDDEKENDESDENSNEEDEHDKENTRKKSKSAKAASPTRKTRRKSASSKSAGKKESSKSKTQSTRSRSSKAEASEKEATKGKRRVSKSTDSERKRRRK